MYTLVLILGSTLHSVGTYSNLDTCNAQVLHLKSQNVTALCSPQQDPEQAMAKMLNLMLLFQKKMEQ